MASKAFQIILVVFVLFVLYSQLTNKPKTTINTVVPSPSPTIMPTNTQIPQISELKIEDQKVGTGKEVKSGDTISIHYTGTLLDGKKFDSSRDRGEPFETQIGVGQVIKGWDVGVIGMKVGGKRKLTIPADMAYGSREIPDIIPANSPLIFEVELVAIK